MLKVTVRLLAVMATIISLTGVIGVVAPAGALPDSAVIVPSPNSGPTDQNVLNSVSCASKTWCVAVGQWQGDSAVQTLALSWDGTDWTRVVTPNTSPTDENSLMSVSCVSASSCIAVGWYDESGTERTLILSWDGIAWSRVVSPNSAPGELNNLWGVSCVSAVSCTAVGYYDSAGSGQPLVLSWDGINWTMVPSPAAEVGESKWLTSVSCFSATSCTAVGSYSPGGAVRQTLVLSWDGTIWSQVPSPNVDPLERNRLNSVSCASRSSCVAVGYYRVGSIDETVVLAWDGAAWTRSTTPDVSGDDGLESVSCDSASSCVAVGYTTVSSANETLVLTWDGTVWTRLASPNPNPTGVNDLLGVSCISMYRCTAVGATGVTLDRTLVLSLTSPEPDVTPIDDGTIVPAFTG